MATMIKLVTHADLVQHSAHLSQMLDDALTSYDKLAAECAEAHCLNKRLQFEIDALRRQKGGGYYWRFFWAAIAACVMTLVAGAGWVAWWLK